MNVDEALLVADESDTGFAWHLETMRVLAAEVRRQHAELEQLRDSCNGNFLRAKEWAARSGRQEREIERLRAKLDAIGGDV